VDHPANPFHGVAVEHREIVAEFEKRLRDLMGGFLSAGCPPVPPVLSNGQEALDLIGCAHGVVFFGCQLVRKILT